MFPAIFSMKSKPFGPRSKSTDQGNHSSFKPSNHLVVKHASAIRFSRFHDWKNAGNKHGWTRFRATKKHGWHMLNYGLPSLPENRLWTIVSQKIQWNFFSRSSFCHTKNSIFRHTLLCLCWRSVWAVAYVYCLSSISASNSQAEKTSPWVPLAEETSVCYKNIES